MTELISTAARPKICLIDQEAETLANLALEVEATLPQVSSLLLEEIARAELCAASTIPPDVATMHSIVTYRDEISEISRTVEIVYPAEADITAGRISILTPIGAGLIGLRKGASIPWPDRSGRLRIITIIDVEPRVRGELQ